VSECTDGLSSKLGLVESGAVALKKAVWQKSTLWGEETSMPLRRNLILMAAWCLGLLSFGHADDPVRKKVLFIGIDGCRHDAVVAANTPHIDRLIETGTRFVGTDILSPKRSDDANTVSGPGWSNLLTGVWPNKHGVGNNRFLLPKYDNYPHFFARAKEVQPALKTASFSDWGPIADNILRASDHTVSLPADGADDYTSKDAELAAACSQHLQSADPDLVFLYLGQVDERGHGFGFHPTVKQYVTGIENVDQHIGQVLSAIQSRPKRAQEDWLVLIGTDHGGAGTDHGDGHSNPDIRRTFLIVSGPAAEVNAPQKPTYQVDIVATALTHMGVALRPEWKLDGQPVGLKPISQ
jgi:predicted AlkP superfamily pyrophosphatase or phosphodiesterase